MHTKLVLEHRRVTENTAIETGRYQIRKTLVCNTNEFELYHEGIKETPKNSCCMGE